MSADEITLPVAAGAERHVGGQIGRYRVVELLGRGSNGAVFRAHDAELARDVALKVLHSEVHDEWLAAEAQAMARLSDPHVVAVYEVARAGERRFIAMELVAGQTLRDWTQSRRPWREVLAMFISAGRGLAAAHVAGLVHRDFKPENVLVGADGRPRVSDFGLVSRPEVRGLAAGTAGTPGYMAPEQWRGEAVDARADQFAFAVATWEGLWGARPFDGETRAELEAAVTEGTIAPLAARAGVPRRIEAALRRALAPAPADRWPEMPALLDELQRASRGRRTLAFVGIGAAALTAGALGAGFYVRSAPAACPIPDAPQVWGPARRAEVARAVSTRIPVHGADRLARVAPVFDEALAAWRASSVATCRANRIDRHDSDTLHDQRVRCLDGWLHELDETVALVAGAPDSAALERAVEAALSLSPVARCDDLAALSRIQPPPPAQRAAIEALRRDVVAARVARRGGGPDGRVAAAALVARARAFAHPPTLALALEELAEAQLAAADSVAASATLDELTQVAAAAGDDRLAAVAAVDSIRAMRELQQADKALASLKFARAAVTRAGDELSLAVQLASYEASLLGASGHSADALSALEAVRALLDGPTALPAAEVARLAIGIDMSTATTLASARRYDDAVAAFERAIATAIAHLGPDYPNLFGAYMNLAETHLRAGHADESAAALREAARIAEARPEQRKLLARIRASQAAAELSKGHPAEALTLSDAALALARDAAPDDAVLRLQVGQDRGIILGALGRYPDAVAALTDQIELGERAHLQGPTRFTPFTNRGSMRLNAGDLPGALGDFQRAVEMIEALPPERHVHLVSALSGYGETLVRMDRPALAIAPLERALAVEAPGPLARTKPRARYFLARALAESGRDRARALVEARAARAELAASDDGARWLPVVDAFIAHGGRRPGGVAPPPGTP